VSHFFVECSLQETSAPSLEVSLFFLCVPFKHLSASSLFSIARKINWYESVCFGEVSTHREEGEYGENIHKIHNLFCDLQLIIHTLSQNVLVTLLRVLLHLFIGETFVPF
jgi:hypothetical protein